MKFQKANIIIITLFITLIIWLMWLLVTKYIYQLVNISAENLKYYKAYYIWYAWVELELFKLKHHWLWFEDSINWNSNTILKNWTGLNYYFSSKIVSLSKNITSNPLSLLFSWVNCSNKDNWIKLKTWDAILLPLFYDLNSWEGYLSWNNYKLLPVNFSSITLNYKWNFVISLQTKKESENIKSWVWWEWDKSFSDILWILNYWWSELDEPYIVIWALENSSFCISSYSKLVNIFTYIQSRWSYMDRKVLLNIAKKNKWANFTVYWLYWN